MIENENPDIQVNEGTVDVPAANIEDTEASKVIIDDKKEEAPQYDMENFNKFFEKEYENVDQLKGDLSNLEKLKEYEDLSSNYSKLEESNKLLSEQTENLKKEREEYLNYNSIEKQYGSKEQYREFKIMQKMEAEGKNMSIVKNVLKSDIKNMDIFTKVVNKEMLDVSNLDYGEAAELVFKELGIPKDRYEDVNIKSTKDLLDLMEPGELGQLKKMASIAEKDMLGIKNTEVEEYKNFEQQYNENVEKQNTEKETLINNWSQHFDKIKSSIDSIKFTEKAEDGTETVEFEYTIDKDVIGKFSDWAKAKVLDSKLEVTDKNIENLKQLFVEEYAKENWRAIADSKASHIRTKLTSANYEKNNNAKAFSTQTNNQTKKESLAARQSRQLGYK